MNTQPEALRLAAHLEFPDGCPNEYIMRMQAAAKLRRLHALNQELLEALKFVMSAHGEQLDLAFEQANTAIAKATGTTP